MPGKKKSEVKRTKAVVEEVPETPAPEVVAQPAIPVAAPQTIITPGGSIVPPSMAPSPQIPIGAPVAAVAPQQTPDILTSQPMTSAPNIAESSYGTRDEEGDLVPLEKSNKKIYYLSMVITAIVFFATGAFFYFRAYKMQQAIKETQQVVATEEPKSTMEAVATPVATDSAVLTRADIKLEVLNATGKAGVAKEKAKIFEDLGYKDIKVGNSTENITGNQIYILKGSKEKLSVLLQDADEKLDIASIAGELADLTTDAKIIIGK